MNPVSYKQEMGDTERSVSEGMYQVVIYAPWGGTRTLSSLNYCILTAFPLFL